MYQKYEYGHLGSWYFKSTLCNRFLYWKKKFPKRSKAVTGKTAFIVIGPLCAPHSFCLNNGFWEGSFVWKCYTSNCDTFNWKTILQFFLKRFSFFRKVKTLGTLKISSDCHIKTCQSLKPRAILKICSTVFLEESMLSLLALKLNL